MKGNQLSLVEDPWKNEKGLDDYLTRLCLDETMGNVVKGAEAEGNYRSLWGRALISNAVFDKDIGLCRSIIQRIDGTVPEENKRDGYANIVGDALQDIMDMPLTATNTVLPSDPPIIAIAKVIYYVSIAPTGQNPQKIKQRQLAVDIVFERCGGKKTAPTKPLLETKYEDPAWLSPGETDD